jgi:hypothetical protein
MRPPGLFQATFDLTSPLGSDVEPSRGANHGPAEQLFDNQRKIPNAYIAAAIRNTCDPVRSAPSGIGTSEVSRCHDRRAAYTPRGWRAYPEPEPDTRRTAWDKLIVTLGEDDESPEPLMQMAD